MALTEIEKINNKLDQVLDENRRILFYLNNDVNTGSKGLIQSVRDMGEDISKIKLKMAISGAKRAVWNTIFGVIGGSLAAIVKYIFFK